MIIGIFMIIIIVVVYLTYWCGLLCCNDYKSLWLSNQQSMFNIISFIWFQMSTVYIYKTIQKFSKESVGDRGSKWTLFIFFVKKKKTVLYCNLELCFLGGCLKNEQMSRLVGVHAWCSMQSLAWKHWGHAIWGWEEGDGSGLVPGNNLEEGARWSCVLNNHAE